MLRKQVDILAIGDITTDAFIRLKDANAHCRVDTENNEICLPFAGKVPFEYVKAIMASGNAGNAAVAAARLGLSAGLVSDIGDDQSGRDSLVELQKNKVVTSFVKVHGNIPTNCHFVLWYDEDRTILVHHNEYDYRLPDALTGGHSGRLGLSKGLPPKWIYLTSLASNAFPYHMAIADYLESHPKVKLAFQPGTFQMQLGFEELKRVYARTDLFVVNVEEAERILKIDTTKMTKSAEKRAGDIKTMMKKIASYGPKMVAITDNTDGAYFYDGERSYHMPMYPDPRLAFERTGCGDAWTSTFVSALAMGKAPLEALVWAPVNPMSVAQFVGAQEGLLTLDQLEWWLTQAPDEYKPQEI
jgi:sugar/nucleoside kinase (ribokinase family)